LAVTIHDVARKAGVSTATVSLIYNRTEHATRLSQATRVRVLAAIDELGYQPNAGARSIRLKRYESIGINFAGEGYAISPGQFYTHVLEGIENAVSDGDYLCVLGRTHELSEDIPKFMRMRCVDGFLALHRLNESTYQAALRAGIPLLTVNTRGPAGIPSILYDDADSMTQVLEQLWAKGHRRIAYFSSNIEHDSHADRLRAYEEWTRGRGLPSNVSPPWNLRPQSTADFFAWLRARLADAAPITAAAVYNQHILWEIMQEQTAGPIAIPQVLSLAVCEFSPHSSFELDTLQSAGMRYEPFEMGQLAGKAMIEHLAAGKLLQDQTIRAKWQDGDTVRPV
jgi:LacI family transcriptional regulator